jgi:hypothetical protein
MTISVEVCPGRKKERIALYCTWHQIRMMGEKSSETAIEDDGKGRGKKPSHTSIKMAQSEHTATEHVVQK